MSSSSTGISDAVRRVQIARRKPVLKVIEANDESVRISKNVEDLVINLRITLGRKQDWNINTRITLLDKLLHVFAQYSKFNIYLQVEAEVMKPVNQIVENVGRALGEALSILARERSKTTGVKALGYSQGLYEEAFAEVRILISDKVGCWITRGANVKFFGRIGDLSEEAMKSLFVEFAQGINGTLHIDLLRGEDPYNLWHAVFIAFGEALRQAFTEDEWNKQKTIAQTPT